MSETSLVDDYVSDSLIIYDRVSGKYNSLFANLPEEITQFKVSITGFLHFFVRYTYQEVERGFEIYQLTPPGASVPKLTDTDEVTLGARPLKDRYFEQRILYGRRNLVVPRFAAQLIELTHGFPPTFVRQTIFATWHSPKDKEERRAKSYLHALGGNYVNAVVTELEHQVKVIISNRSGKLDELVFNWFPETSQGLVLLCTHPHGPYYFQPSKRQLDHVEYLKYVNIVVDCYHAVNEGKNWGNFQRKKK